MNLPRILILDTSPIRRGAQVFAQEFAEHLATKGYSVKRVYLFLSKENQTVSVGNQDCILSFFEESILEKFPSFQPGLLRKLSSEIESFKPQIILCNGSKTLKYGAWIKIFGFAKGAKLIGRFIDDAVFWNEKGFKKWAYTNWLNQLDGIVSVSQASSDSMIQHYRFQKPNTVIHRVFDAKKFRNFPNREEARKLLSLNQSDEVLLFLGNLTEQKRPDRFIEIVSQLSKSRPNLKVLIVGDGPMRKSLEYRVSFEKEETRNKNQEAKAENQEMGDDSAKSRVASAERSRSMHLKSCVSLTGYQQDVSLYLAAADLLILTSDTEGLPGVVLEAAHFGVPTVATEVGGIRECLIDGETGILVPNRSVSAFCEKINFLLDHPQDRLAMGAKANAFITENFQMGKGANQYLTFFEQLLEMTP